MPSERRSTDPGRRAADKGGSHFRKLVTSAVIFLAVSQLAVSLFMWEWQRAYRENVHKGCLIRNAQWDAVIARDRALLADSRTSAVISDIRQTYEDELAVLTRTRVDCDTFRASPGGQP